MLPDKELAYLERCIELAREALQAGDDPFGSILVDDQGQILKEDRNRIVTGNDISLHPELTLATWAYKNLPPNVRASATVYTSGEHCPMCAAAHSYAGLGRIVFASSSKQLRQWKEELGAPTGEVAALPIEMVVKKAEVEGPVEELGEKIFELHRLRWEKVCSQSQGQ
ncbi:hypothetical protein PDE_08965 [Penicillium oxalicum 114-2]|uniref:CMP/dCMP-type deaminase domain-containing protein n=1 Tax=Penicillium oxalicum (strain 114-2 / CGMCC 5302) TaxID=933388 RepID=S8B569_PENO1|nr:hypothetical protein PDE_08965 [Penicillium oxalicum 114-2]